MGTAYSYLQDFLPHVAQAAVREGWVDLVGLGRMVLSYPELLWDASEGQAIQRKRICRTFSDCTTAPRKGLPSGCYPLDSHYKDSELMELSASRKSIDRVGRTRFEEFGMMTIEALIETATAFAAKCTASRRHLLPYESDGRVAVEAFQKLLVATHRAGLMNAVNMDTGYVNYLSDAEKHDVLRWTREALGKDVPFVAGAYIENQTGDIVALYRQQIDPIVFARRHSDFVSDGPAARQRQRKKKRQLIRRCARAIRRCWLSNWARCSRRTARSLTRKRSAA